MANKFNKVCSLCSCATWHCSSMQIKAAAKFINLGSLKSQRSGKPSVAACCLRGAMTQNQWFVWNIPSIKSAKQMCDINPLSLCPTNWWFIYGALSACSCWQGCCCSWALMLNIFGSGRDHILIDAWVSADWFDQLKKNTYSFSLLMENWYDLQTSKYKKYDTW